jgi:hypothetical protein
MTTWLSKGEYYELSTLQYTIGIGSSLLSKLWHADFSSCFSTSYWQQWASKSARHRRFSNGFTTSLAGTAISTGTSSIYTANISTNGSCFIKSGQHA